MGFTRAHRSPRPRSPHRAAFVSAAALSIASVAGASVRTIDLVYQSPGNTVFNRFDLYTPDTGVAVGAPTILDLHGGGYTTGDKGLDQQVCYAVADRGYNVISMNYTLAWPGQYSSFPQTFRDVRAMIRWIRTTGVSMGLSPTIIITGQSAGCTIGVAAAYAPESPEFVPPLSPPPGGYAIDAVVGLFGRYDLVWDAQTFGSPQSVINYLGMPITSPGGLERYAAAAARTYVDACSPPTKLVVGDDDGVVPSGNTTRLASALQAAGVFTILNVIPGAGHGTGPLGSPPFLADQIASAVPTLLSAPRDSCGGGIPPPVNDLCGAAPEIPLGPVNGTTLGAHPSGALGCAAPNQDDVFYAFTAGIAGRYRFDLAGSSLAPAVLGVYSDCGGQPLACADDALHPGSPSPRTELNMGPGDRVLIRVAAPGHGQGSFILSVSRLRPPSGACCLSGQCGFTDADTCAAAGGAFWPDRACDSIPCTGIGAPPGACCAGTACSLAATAAECTGAFMGSGSVCGDPGNPVACCPANFNHTGGVTVQDIFDFLAAYFAGSTAADFDRSGALGVQDIFDFLAAYFTGCT